MRLCAQLYLRLCAQLYLTYLTSLMQSKKNNQEAELTISLAVVLQGKHFIFFQSTFQGLHQTGIILTEKQHSC